MYGPIKYILKWNSLTHNISTMMSMSIQCCINIVCPLGPVGCPMIVKKFGPILHDIIIGLMIAPGGTLYLRGAEALQTLHP